MRDKGASYFLLHCACPDRKTGVHPRLREGKLFLDMRQMKTAPEAAPLIRSDGRPSSAGCHVQMRVEHHHGRADLDPMIEVDHVLVGHADAAG
jgi:hypothetical protein